MNGILDEFLRGAKKKKKIKIWNKKIRILQKFPAHEKEITWLLIYSVQMMTFGSNNQQGSLNL